MQVIPRGFRAGRSSEQTWLGFAEKAIIPLFDQRMLLFEKLRTVAASIFSKSDLQDHLYTFDFNSEDSRTVYTNVNPTSLPRKSLYLTGFKHPHEHRFNSKISHDAICFTRVTRAVHFQGMLDVLKGLTTQPILHTVSTKRKVLMYLLHSVWVCLFVFFYLVNFKQGWDVWLWRNKPPNRPPKQTPKQASETHPLGHIPGWARRSENTTWLHAHVNTYTHTCTHFVPTNLRWRYFRMGTGAAFGSFPGCAVWWLLWWRCCRRFGVLAEVVTSFLIYWFIYCPYWFAEFIYAVCGCWLTAEFSIWAGDTALYTYICIQHSATWIW